MRDRIDHRAMALLSAGHAAVDFSGGALPALLPFLKDEFHLSYTLVAVLILASALSSSIVQPLFGLWSDARGAIWLLPAGVALGGIGMAAAADAPSYWLVVLFVILSGLGTAAYHPEGSKFAAFASGRKRASGMSLFTVGGNLGYGLGALVVTPIIVAAGLRGGWFLVVPAVAVATLLLAATRYLVGFVPPREARAAREGRNDVRSLSILLTVITFRSLAWFGLITFVPLYEVSLGHSESYGNYVFAGMLLVGALGTLLAGPLADRVGLRTVLRGSFVLSTPLMLVFLLVGGIPGAVALAGVGAAIVGTFGVTMVMAQEYLPGNIGMASGLAIGFAIGLGGVAAVLIGAVADSIDLRSALFISAAAPMVALALTALLPPTGQRPRLEPEVAVP
ncbi:MAG TPA: MFS transporter [Gaiellaceae bacterium]|nr:MFS transporter [Gaiellaceae bacterium]